jgi:hypothetical protein
VGNLTTEPKWNSDRRPNKPTGGLSTTETTVKLQRNQDAIRAIRYVFFLQNGRMNPKLQFDRRARRRAMPIVGCAFARYNLNVRFWQNEPNRFLLECPCLDVPTWQTQWHFAPAAAPSATRCERTAAAAGPELAKFTRESVTAADDPRS